MNRRRFLSGTANTIGALSLLGAADATSQQTAAGTTHNGRAPNVLLLMADQHRRSAMGVAGDRVAHTPNLDALAAQSVRFTNAYCTNPICAASRASMLTGLYTHKLYNRTGRDQPYSPRCKTFVEHFARAGYFTALVGKMHSVDAQLHGFQYQLEFNDWFQTLGSRAGLYANETFFPNSGAGLPQIHYLWSAEEDPWKAQRKSDGRLGTVAVGGASKMAEPDHFESFVARESIRFLENHGKSDEPFFLTTSFLKPHDPFMPAERFAAMYDAADIQLSPSWGKADLAHLPKLIQEDIRTSHFTPELLRAEAARQRVAAYYGNLAQTDDCIGQVLAALQRLDLQRDTIVVYTSDHGEMLGDLGLWNKFQFYEGSCGVPLMFRIPAVHAAVCEAPVSLISLGTTIAELCNVSLPGPSDGSSFADLLAHPSFSKGDRPIFAEFDLGRPGEKYMIRENHLKYTFWVHDRPELYDLSADPEELHNLAVDPEYAATISRLQTRLFAWYRPPLEA